MIVFGDAHAHPSHNNNRAGWLANLIIDEKPDVIVNLGDQGDFPSLCSYDKGKKSFQGRSYKQDIESFLDFSNRLWTPLKRRKKKLPRAVFLHGNHEYRINRAIEVQPELDGAIGLHDLCLEDHYDDIVYYNGQTPGTITIEGVTFGHYFVSGIMGRPIASDTSIANALLTKQYTSCTTGHSHLLDFSVRTNGQGKKIIGFSAGCYLDADLTWAGNVNKLWGRGVAIKNNVSNGMYDISWVSMDSLKKEYSK